MKLTRNNVDIGATPKHVAFSPFGSLSDESDGAIATLELFGQGD